VTEQYKSVIENNFQKREN
jgi:hypothetical protein